jgi:hypothetical protein
MFPSDLDAALVVSKIQRGDWYEQFGTGKKGADV